MRNRVPVYDVGVRDEGRKRHVFSLARCEEGYEFQVDVESPFYRIADKFFACDVPEVVVMAETTVFSAFILKGGGSSGPVPAYLNKIEATLRADESVLVGLGEAGQGNHAALLDALDQGDFGAAAFLANENAALARKLKKPELAIGYATLSYDVGFRAMGLDPSGGGKPLVAIDPGQAIPVPTPEGKFVLEKFNSAANARNVDVWSYDTTRALRQLAPLDQNYPLLAVDDPGDLLQLKFDTSGRFQFSG